ncbi:hypothetical protein D3C77_671180 [compost metagenome]
MLLKGLRSHRQILARQVLRTAAQGQSIAADHPRNQPRQVIVAFTQRQVITTFQQVDEGIAQIHLQADLRVLLQKAVTHLIEKRPPIRQWCGAFQVAAQAVL